MAINKNIHVKLDARVYKLMSAGSYKKALKLIENIIVDYPDDDKSFPARGHCQYELKMDVPALETYFRYVKLCPKGQRIHSALFNAALCLKNLGLYEDAEHLLRNLPPRYPCLAQELKHSSKCIANRQLATQLLREFQNGITSQTGR